MIDSAPLVSILIATKNRPDCVVRVLRSIASQVDTTVEIIVVDDGSEPPLPDLGLEVRLIRHESSRGACQARNSGLEFARGEYILIIDDDAELIDPTTIHRATALAARVATCAVIGFMQLAPDGTPRSDQPTCSKSVCRVGKFFAYACLCRRRAVMDVGGFNHFFTYYYEEIELSMRLLDAGYDVLYDPSLRVIHHQNPSGRDPRRIRWLALRNACFAAVLRYPWWCVPPALTSYALHYLRTGRAARNLDLGGLIWSFIELIKSGPRLLWARRSIRFQTFRRMRALTRSPEPLD